MELKINKKLVALLLSCTLVPGVAGCSNKDKKDMMVINSIGHEDVNPYFNFNLDEEDFVLLNVGNHDSFSYFLDDKIKWCNKNDITLGVIVSSDSLNEEDIYDDVEYIKSIIKDYDVNFPVYLDINNIINNDKLNNEMKSKIIKNFLEKCSSNGIYVGVYGSDTNLCRMKEYFGITEYDSYLEMDSKEIKYDGVVSIIKGLDGSIKCSEDLEKVIESKGLNDVSKFCNDLVYTLKDGEDILDVSLKYGLSVESLLRFNDLEKKEITSGTAIRIPSVSVMNKYEEGMNFKYLDEPIRGCDISYAQKDSPNWDLLRENFEFIILKCNEGLDVDPYFEVNANNCSINDIPMGVYCYNGYSNENCSDLEEFRLKQEAQADKTIEALKNKKVLYPVYLDIEKSGGLTKDYLTAEQVKVMLEVWVNKMTGAGYIPGVYCNKSGLNYLESCVSYNLGDVFQLWIAGGDQYFSDKRDIDIKEVRPSTILDENLDIVMAQSTDSCVNGGAGNASGHLDVNFSYVDYAKDMRKNIDLEIKEFEKIDFGKPSLIAGGVVLLGSAVGIMKKRKKKSL